MAYFPILKDLENQTVLILGGGHVAFRKACSVHDFGARVLMVSEHFLDSVLRSEWIEGIQSSWDPVYLKQADLMICASDDFDLNKEAARQAKALNIPVNVVDDAADSTFIFPAVIHEKDLVIGISTNGASPAAAVWLKRQIQKVIPDCLPEVLDFLQEVRPVILKEIHPESVRKACFKELFALCMQNNRPLTEAEMDVFLKEWMQMNE